MAPLLPLIAQTLTSTLTNSPQNPLLRPLALLLRGGRLVGRVVVAGLELVDGGADGEVGHEVLRVEDEARLRRRVVADEPLLDGVALVGVAVGCEDRVVHELARDRAHVRVRHAERGAEPLLLTGARGTA